MGKQEIYEKKSELRNEEGMGDESRGKKSHQLLRSIRYQVPQCEDKGGVEIMEDGGRAGIEQFSNLGGGLNRGLREGICYENQKVKAI